MKIIGFALAAVCLSGVILLAGLLVFGAGKPPPPMPSIDQKAAGALKGVKLPKLKWYTGALGAQLAYREYGLERSDRPQHVAILVHGSGGSSANMDAIGRALEKAGIPAFAPDIRGHGASGRNGDIDYTGELEDDLGAMAATVRAKYPSAKVALVGHSSGGGFVLRAAGEPVGKQFSNFVLLAPYLGDAAPTTRKGGGGTRSGGWVSSYTGRIIAISILNGFGIHWFDGLPTLAFASRSGLPVRTWSFRLMSNFAVSNSIHATDHRGYIADANRAPGKISIIAGERDEIMYAKRYKAAFSTADAQPSLILIPDIGHIDIITDQRALAAVVKTVGGG